MQGLYHSQVTEEEADLAEWNRSGYSCYTRLLMPPRAPRTRGCMLEKLKLINRWSNPQLTV